MGETVIKHYPGWAHALDVIVERVGKQGHGIFFSHEELKKLMEIKEPKTIEDYKQNSLEYMNSVDHLRKELLQNHQMWLDNKRGDGYIILHPDDQVSKVPKDLIAKASAVMGQAVNVLTNVRAELLSLEAGATRLRNFQRVAFLQRSFRKRKIPQLKNPPHKLKALAEGGKVK